VPVDEPLTLDAFGELLESGVTEFVLANFEDGIVCFDMILILEDLDIEEITIDLGNGVSVALIVASIDEDVESIDLNFVVDLDSDEIEIDGVVFPAGSIIITPPATLEGDFGFTLVFTVTDLGDMDADDVNLYYVWGHGNHSHFELVEDAVTVNADGSVTVTLTSASYYILSDVVIEVIVEDCECDEDDCEICNPDVVVDCDCGECGCDECFDDGKCGVCEDCAVVEDCDCDEDDCEICNPDVVVDCECGECGCDECFEDGECGVCEDCKPVTPEAKWGPNGIGNVMGDDFPGIDDVIEILKWMVGLESVLDDCDDAMLAATLDSSKAEPDIDDVIDILKWMVNLDRDTCVLYEVYGLRADLIA
jgi:hypothetical protein